MRWVVTTDEDVGTILARRGDRELFVFAAVHDGDAYQRHLTATIAHHLVDPTSEVLFPEDKRRGFVARVKHLGLRLVPKGNQPNLSAHPIFESMAERVREMCVSRHASTTDRQVVARVAPMVAEATVRVLVDRLDELGNLDEWAEEVAELLRRLDLDEDEVERATPTSAVWERMLCYPTSAAGVAVGCPVMLPMGGVAGSPMSDHHPLAVSAVSPIAQDEALLGDEELDDVLGDEALGDEALDNTLDDALDDSWGDDDVTDQDLLLFGDMAGLGDEPPTDPLPGIVAELLRTDPRVQTTLAEVMRRHNGDGPSMQAQLQRLVEASTQDLDDVRRMATATYQHLEALSALQVQLTQRAQQAQDLLTTCRRDERHAAKRQCCSPMSPLPGREVERPHHHHLLSPTCEHQVERRVTYRDD